MELQPDIVVHSLKLLVDPADGSYTPSLLIVSAADSLSNMKEIAVVTVGLQVLKLSLLFSFFAILIRCFIFTVYRITG